MLALAPETESATIARTGTRKEDATTARMTHWDPNGHDSDSDDDLLERIGNDDQSAFRLLVERHLDRAYALALRILKNAADAEDVVQDSLLKVWSQRGRWEGGRAKFSTWLYRVVTNRCIDLRRQSRTDGMDDMSQFVDEKPDAFATLHREEVGHLLESAIQKLPEQQRIAVVLSYHQGLGNAEIAEVMETTVSAVESLLKRGRQQLRHLIRRGGDDMLQAFADD
jgi:RNA polymerase sigma-70 factor (ECF subfamily)